MQDYDPKWSAVVVVDYFTDIGNAAKVLTICLEQIAENPPDLIPRLHWLIRAVKADLECVASDGGYEAQRVKDYLHVSVEYEADECDRPAGTAADD